jgi:predicted dehydrogenase
MSSNHGNSRRKFLKLGALGTAAIGLSPLNQIFGSEAEPSGSTDIQHTSYPGTGNRKSAMGLSCEPIQIVRIGIIGLGMRGSEAVYRLMQIRGVEIKAISDMVPANIKSASKQILDAGKPAADEYNKEDDWIRICDRDDIDLIYNCTPWYLHTPIAIYAMKNGKHTAIEVPAATTLEECWDLVRTAEETQRHCMMLENCCYDFFELTTLNMARNGVFGDIYYGEGAYNHDLRWLKFAELSEGGYYNKWRLEYSKYHTGNLYPTHGLGPVAQIMGINRGDRFDYLTSVSTEQRGLTLYAIEKFGQDSPEARQEYKLGDMNTTIIHTTLGKTIMIQHDTTSPRPYSRIHLISGTKGLAVKYPVESITFDPISQTFLKSDEYDQLMKKWEHPLINKIGEKAKEVGGHGGMDFIMDYRLIYCLQKGLPLDQDVYDAAAWSSIIELSEKSVLKKGVPMAIPDFTQGLWESATPFPVVSID